MGGDVKWQGYRETATGFPGKARAKIICKNPHLSFYALEVCTSSARFSILLRGFTISAGIGEFATQASVGV